jgi:hypothetical protein
LGTHLKEHSLLIIPPQDNPRTLPLLAVAKANNLDVELVEPAVPAPAEYLLLNKLGKIPTFEGADGYVLSEAIAIAIYCTSCITLLSIAPVHDPRVMMNKITIYSYP